MAEEHRRSFDLKSWQGLTEVLKVARESGLSPDEYASFRNLVLSYAQQKGTDADLKQKIDAVIASFDAPKTSEASGDAHAWSRPPERLSRRPIPTFTVRRASVSSAPVPHAHQEPVQDSRSAPLDPEVRDQPVAQSVDIVDPPPGEHGTLVDTSASGPIGASDAGTERRLKSVEEHKARIMEIKREINALVANPITLVDHGNTIGKAYMSALLVALKSTNPGATHALEGAMESLEDARTQIIEFLSRPQDGEDQAVALREDTVPVDTTVSVKVTEATTVPEVNESPMVEESVKKNDVDQVDTPASPHAEVTSAVPTGEAPVSPVTEVSSRTQNNPVSSPEESAETTSAHEESWTEAGGDPALDEQIKMLREQLNATKPIEPKGARIGRLIPSILDINDERAASDAKEQVHSVVPVATDAVHTVQQDELSMAALTHRPESTMTGITLSTPQAELMTPEVTMALTELLHEWKLFASSGLFGMGPGGVEHPLYVRIAHLPMNEVLTGRFEGADMKIVHTIKDYIDAWRHEQGVAYAPTETFEHYLRRVAQRILKRQTGSEH